MRKGLVVILFLATSAFAEKWEYLKVVNSPDHLGIDNLNKLGSQCWQLVACPVDSKEMGKRVTIDGVVFTPYAYAVANYCIFTRRLSGARDPGCELGGTSQR